ncbi:hypothetical protein NMD07_25525 (plasmid) [Citrobacter cronae]|uniref:hypothetical protein n=1 Tax=Citrobacter cronae TaxID=1748967 RepID=UPI00351D2302
MGGVNPLPSVRARKTHAAGHGPAASGCADAPPSAVRVAWITWYRGRGLGVGSVWRFVLMLSVFVFRLFLLFFLHLLR